MEDRSNSGAHRIQASWGLPFPLSVVEFCPALLLLHSSVDMILVPFVRSRVAHRKSAGYMNVAYIECMSKAVEGMALATFEGRQEGYLMA